MKQFQHQYTDENELRRWLTELHRYAADGHFSFEKILFYIQTDSRDQKKIAPVVRLVTEMLPGSLYAGSSGNGNIVEGRFVADSPISVIATVYEDPYTQVEVMQLPVTYETQADSARRLLEAVQSRPWVKAIEMMTTIRSVDMPELCREISELPEDVHFYGGGALARDTHDGVSEGPFVFSSDGEPDEGSAVFILQGGQNFHVETRFITGWRRLGLPFEVTGAQNNILKTLDHKPALEVYQHFLQVPKDEHYFEMSVVFPFAFEDDGVPYLRVSTAYLEDGSMILGSDIREHTRGNIAFGDPASIRKSVREAAEFVEDFRPDAIRLYSCASRQLYWGEDEVSRETSPFAEIASTSGYYTSGEFLRTNGKIFLHNVTIALAALREGEPVIQDHPPVRVGKEPLSRQILINNCLSSFINAATEQLEEANQNLARMAVTDGLTGLDNRTSIEHQIENSLTEFRENMEIVPSIVILMIDLDNFKEINDTYGHQEGDQVLKKVSSIFSDMIGKYRLDAAAGRWGGEEFMFLIRNADLTTVQHLAEEIRETFADYEFEISGRHTLSAGITKALPKDTADGLCLRVDKGLYRAKENGKNQIVII